MSENITARAWVGCLACYNNGDLIGEWFDATDVPTTMAELNAKLNISGRHLREGDEELWVFDHEGFRGFLDGEFSPTEAKRVGDLIEAIEGAHFDPDVVAKWAEIQGVDVATMEWDGPTEMRFQDEVRTAGESLGDYAVEYHEGSEWYGQIPDEVRAHIDWEAIGEDMTSGQSVERINGTLYVIGE